MDKSVCVIFKLYFFGWLLEKARLEYLEYLGCIISFSNICISVSKIFMNDFFMYLDEYYQGITTDISTHLLYLEDTLKRLPRTIKSSIGEYTYDLSSTSGSQPGLLYGFTKVHKPNIPLRPIISSIGTFNYNTAKFLVPILSPLTTNKYTTDNSTTFANEITSLDPKQPVTMASFDVESLF
ncbi:uncharacterized protein LOC119580713 [Penaeus monodon]|uniref:uncharacterized protein LOC119580713 n=1 Tax=Penaeus monodon TaxID=6687 RepID=UPI0018A7A8E0|nr:uncharacterized protein LOC119580713 [Penaeus monodon]